MWIYKCYIAHVSSKIFSNAPQQNNADFHKTHLDLPSGIVTGKWFEWTRKTALTFNNYIV